MQPDIIGRIVKTPATYDEDGNQLTAPVLREGFHVNTPEPVPEWEGWRMDPQPATPIRTYQGDRAPICYRFPGEATYEREYNRAFGKDETTEV